MVMTVNKQKALTAGVVATRTDFLGVNRLITKSILAGMKSYRSEGF
jgi:hypothetical protein